MGCFARSPEGFPTLLVLVAKSAAADSQLRETLRLALFRLVAPGVLNPREDSRLLLLKPWGLTGGQLRHLQVVPGEPMR